MTWAESLRLDFPANNNSVMCRTIMCHQRDGCFWKQQVLLTWNPIYPPPPPPKKKRPSPTRSTSSLTLSLLPPSLPRYFFFWSCHIIIDPLLSLQLTWKETRGDELSGQKSATEYHRMTYSIQLSSVQLLLELVVDYIGFQRDSFELRFQLF